MELLSDYAAVDFYQIMIASRHPETEVESKQRLIKEINSVAPGLYQKLRQLPYTLRGFKQGLQIIQDVTTK